MSNDVFFRTPELSCRRVRPEEEALVAEAAAMDLLAWGPVLGQGPERFAQRVRNGFLVGAFQGDALAGTISAVRRAWAPQLEAETVPSHPYATWDGLSSDGTFAVHEDDGDALYCVAVTAKGTVVRPYPAVPAGDHPALDLARGLAAVADADDEVLRYRALALAAATVDLHLPADPVMRFHEKPKGGILGGAKVVLPLPGGRPDDAEAMGYNVVMTYPEIAPGTVFPPAIEAAPSVGETLILGAAALGCRLGVRLVVPYSRPSGFRAALIKSLVAIGTASTQPETPFTAAVRRIVVG
jgi:hypothetical protein